RVEPGAILDRVRDEARAWQLTFGPDPATHDHCTIGGMIGNNSGGVHSVRSGTMVENVHELDILTYGGLHLRVGATTQEELARIIAQGGRRGEIYGRLKSLRDRYADEIRKRFPDIPRRVSGYSLDQLLPEKGFNVARALVGSEGTCVSVLEATLDLIHWHRHRVMVMLGFDDLCNAADHVPMIRDQGAQAIEGIDSHLVRNMKHKNLHAGDVELLPDGDAWLLVEFAHDDIDAATAMARKLMSDLEGDRHVCGATMLLGVEEQERMWHVREAGLGATAFVPGERDTWPGWEDSAVAPEDLGNYLRDLQALYRRYDLHGAMYGHFGDGLVHTRIDFGLHTRSDIDRFRKFMFDGADLVARYGGSLSGEHGDGQARSELLKRRFGDELVRAFGEFKAIWDPSDGMNPGNIVDPRPLDADLRMGPRLHPRDVETEFTYPEDDGSFARATLRCVGVGKCRRESAVGTMCPSYKATREERHSTRGRAHLLQEMLHGGPPDESSPKRSSDKRWNNEAVHDALHLCLACKGCKGDCPVNVDMATYKAEFLSHYYRGRMRPRTAHGMGLIHWWARIAALAPWLPNAVMRAPVLGDLARDLVGIHRKRAVPRFAARTFRQDFIRHANPGKPPVVLWTDTFNDHFSPGPLHAAAEVLAATGHHVEIPSKPLCCGRPLYDYGRLDQARRLLRRCIDGLRPQLEAGAFVVGIEPSCIATFRDELLNFFPKDPDARRLAERTLMLPEFLERTGFETPGIGGRAIYHGHCFQKALLGQKCERAILSAGGIDVDVLDSGCCGMAGAFGYEKDKYDVSMRIAEMTLLPRVRRCAPDVQVISDGFSCRTQIEQATGRTPLTIAEVLRDGLHAIRRTDGERHH
ncbi:MAG TPA: FAD-linked oxidase C-terminal domain-containing protein, partial [Arenibaculum sp.]|nr:FAD-linked oxidase C-terminal domain-containing protein [Arenibaculum sp.]